MDVSDEELATEVDRAVCETRVALGRLALQRCLTPALMGLSTLLDRMEVAVITRPGDSAFELVQEEGCEAVYFRVHVLRSIFVAMASFAAEIGDMDSGEVRRAQQVAINLFVIHELMHIQQNFPHFTTVGVVKAGLPSLGLPIFDLVADIVSAWVCAHVEADRLDIEDPGKRQRLLGLVVSAVLAKAKIEGELREDHLLNSWHPASPVLVLNIEECRVFNAMVVDAMSGLLLGTTPSDVTLASAFWESVGEKPVFTAFELAAKLLRQAGAIR